MKEGKICLKKLTEKAEIVKSCPEIDCNQMNVIG